VSHFFDFRKRYPSVYNNPALVEATLRTLRRIAGEANVIESLPGMGGGDFSHFTKVSPGFHFRLGVTNEAKGLTGEGFDIDDERLKTRPRGNGWGDLRLPRKGEVRGRKNVLQPASVRPDRTSLDPHPGLTEASYSAILGG
jgi:hypothetical protein